MAFLPTNLLEMQALGWEQADFIYVSGDAYVDHPSFGHAIITRLLESKGFKVAIIAQPDWRNANDIKSLGRPKYAFLVSSGVIDSMVNHYTANKHPRSQDLYSPGGEKGLRPNRATTVYSNLIRQVYKDVPIIIGGIEASLRRFAHYDYWDDKVRQSVLIDSGADLLIYGMGENPIAEIAERMRDGEAISDITDVKGTCFARANTKPLELPDLKLVPSFEEVSASPKAYAKAFAMQYVEQDPFNGVSLAQPHPKKLVVQNLPALPLSVSQMDEVYKLPFERRAHPMYEAAGGIPALEEVEFSITSHRGCFGGCSFCALTFHQGRIIQKRSKRSIITEGELLAQLPNFKGYIHDVGGPTANFRETACTKQARKGSCRDRQCMFPEPCKNLKIDYNDYISVLRTLREIKGVKKVFIRSGLRFDHMLLEKNDRLLNEICEHHVSGQLKVAPEHIDDGVLQMMGKPPVKVFEEFSKRYKAANERLGKKQYMVPYLIASHPGSDLKAAINLAMYLKQHKINPEQVQDFYPTPSTLSTCMYFTGIDPRTMKKVYVPKSNEERAMQRALLQVLKPGNQAIVLKALEKAGRIDLIGYGPDRLVAPLKTIKKGGYKPYRKK
ncbi:MAG: YgiQ family radical SAM protein [Bacillota bacterium]